MVKIDIKNQCDKYFGIEGVHVNEAAKISNTFACSERVDVQRTILLRFV
jgi:hypothetical protein